MRGARAPPHQPQGVSSFYNAQWDSPPPSYSNGVPMRRVAAPMSPTAYYAPPPPRPAAQGYAHPGGQGGPGGPGGGPGGQGGFAAPMQGAVPLMMAAGMQLAAAGGSGADAAVLGRQLLQSVAPGAAHMGGAARDAVHTFMRLPKYYFAVNNRYVRLKLALLLRPWGQRTWVRQRAVDPGQFAAGGTDGVSSYLPPRDDVNAPDLYIPLMAFATYVLLAGFLLGIRHKFKPQALAQYLSKGAGVLTLEAVVIKLGLYLINAHAPWLDVIAFRGYKFVGVALTMAITIAAPRAYWPVLIYMASAMSLFLMRSHRRIVLPREAISNPAELARRNAFLLFLCALQYPVYWLLVLY